MYLYFYLLHCKLKKNKKKNSRRTGFEPVRVTPSDFESDALTTRPSQHHDYFKRIFSLFNSSHTDYFESKTN